ncbi:MAG: succinate dehydrogenase cytochrome b subunit [Flavobacteriales bacterium]|nr:succinate dehydrogenase cytochrome b subunit [Flavobacteriales bacterium]
MSKAGFSTSSVGRKVFMALTGAFLVVFMLVHLTCNLFVVGGAEYYNAMTHFMGTPIIKYALQPVLALGFILHILFGLYLAVKNSMSRPINYKNANYGAASSWASRYMWLTGIIIFGVIVLHMANYWYKIQIVGGVENDYELVVNLFKDSMCYTILYIVWFVILGVHLAHGFWSMFQTTGQAYVKWLPCLQKLALAYCAVVSLGFIFVALWCRFIA